MKGIDRHLRKKNPQKGGKVMANDLMADKLAIREEVENWVV